MATEVINVDRSRRVVLFDRLTMVAPLGLRFHDVVTNEIVGDGLSVWAYRLDRATAARPLFPNRRGVYVLHDAPGLRDLQNGAGTMTTGKIFRRKKISSSTSPTTWTGLFRFD